MKLKTPLLLGLLLALFASTTRAVPDSVPVINGLMVAGKDNLAAIQIGGSAPKWCAAGDAVGGYTVKAVNVPANSVLLVDRAGKEWAINLATAKVIDDTKARRVALLALEALDWKWIKSDANPMKKLPEDLPEWAAFNWKSLSEDTKMEFRNYYRSHGFDLAVEVKNPRIIHVSCPRLVDPSTPPLTEAQKRERLKSAKPVQPIAPKK